MAKSERTVKTDKRMSKGEMVELLKRMINQGSNRANKKKNT